jgi:hypothetical protein
MIHADEFSGQKPLAYVQQPLSQQLHSGEALSKSTKKRTDILNQSDIHKKRLRS